MNKSIENSYEEEDEDNMDDIGNDQFDMDFDNDDDNDFIIIDNLTKEDSKNIKKITEKKKKGPKPKLIGKHSLAQDTIFKSKKNDIIDIENEESEYIIKSVRGSLDINDDYLGDVESSSNIDSYRESILKNNIYNLLKEKTNLDFLSPIRKPSEVNFNIYFNILYDNLKNLGYSKSEIFIELSIYFTTDKIWNIFKLLNKNHSNDIIDELKNKFGLSDLEKIDFI